MARNLKPEYIRKIINTPAPRGYKFDLANYLHNPSYDYDYPSFVRMVSEDEQTRTYSRILYFKRYNGGGEYREEVYTLPKGEGWHIAQNVQKHVLESSNRFSLSRLLSFCAA